MQISIVVSRGLYNLNTKLPKTIHIFLNYIQQEYLDIEDLSNEDFLEAASKSICPMAMTMMRNGDNMVSFLGTISPIDLLIILKKFENKIGDKSNE